MGTFTHTVRLIAASGDAAETLEALADTGATFTSVPAPILERLGVVPHRAVTLRLANGQVQSYSIGHVKAELDGIQENIICVFGDPGSPAVVGAHTLESFLLVVDPVERRLLPGAGFR